MTSPYLIEPWYDRDYVYSTLIDRLLAQVSEQMGAPEHLTREPDWSTVRQMALARKLAFERFLLDK